jgi:hypothetical protein
METVRVILDNYEGAFDKTVHGQSGMETLPQVSPIRIITKNNGTDGGRAIACVTFDAEIDGRIVRVQAVTTMRLLRGACQILMAKYSADGLPTDG